MSITMVTGGARSGKSTYAEQLAKDHGGRICYIATATITDEDMEERVRRHRLARPKEWTILEQYKDFDQLPMEIMENTDLFLLDCITTMVTNLMFDKDIDYDTCTNEAIQMVEDYVFEEIEKLVTTMHKNNKRVILVTNEVGMGLVPAYRLGSIFRDIAGRVNQYLAMRGEEVYFMISSIPMKIKGA